MPVSRSTRQKRLIEEEVAKLDSFFHAEELHDMVAKKDDKIGLATIYRYLAEAKETGNLFAYSCNRRTIYSRGQKSHCHFVCEKTGEIIHFDVDSLDFLKGKIPGTITSFQIEVKGVCNQEDHKH